jgi:hypothetical protein
MTQTENLALIQTLIAEQPQGIGIAALEKALAQRTGVVRGRLASDPKTLAQLAAGLASAADQAAFVQLLTDALRQLHEGSVARYRLKRSEFLAWKAL